MDTWWPGKNEPKTNPNEAKYKKAKINVNTVITMNYEQRTMNYEIRNEPKTNPNEPKSKKAEMNVNKVLTKEYENISNWAIYENEPNFSAKNVKLRNL